MSIKLTSKILALVLLILIPVLAACSSTPVSASAIHNVSKDLNCVCGCGEILTDCDCETAQELNGVISNGLSKGQPEQDIVQGLIRQYGQRILIE
ncbi:cytochrome c-type biogenesis protein CcmH [Chloroflexota bacterium]